MKTEKLTSMNKQTEQITNYGDILLSCCIPHDMHLEHRMPTHSIIFVCSGKLIVEDRANSVEIMAGNYVFVRRDCSVTVTKVPFDGQPYRGISFSLPRHELKEYYNRIAASCKKIHHINAITQTVNILPQTVALKSLFASFLPYTDSTEEPSAEWLQLKVQEAIMTLLAIDNRFYVTLFDFNEAWKIDLLDFMEKNYTEDLTMEEFASYTGRSLATFKRDFSKISNTSPLRWIMEHRLDKARSLLLEKSVNVQEVGYMVGFKNRSHFSEAFKKRFGCAPSRFQNQR